MKIVPLALSAVAMAAALASASVTAQVSVPAGATKEAGSKTIAAADQKLFNELAVASLSEIEAGKLASDKAEDPEVKKFAQQMVTDHTAALTELTTLAQQKQVKLPTEPDAKHKAEAKKLAGMSGAAFDARYMQKGGVEDHRAALGLVKRTAANAKDSDLKALASKTQPTIEMHLKMAQELAAKHKGGKDDKGMKGK